MRPIITALMLCTLLVTGACTDRVETEVATTEQAATTEASNLSPEELGELGAAIEKDPANAESHLSAKGLNEESFEAAIRRVSEDPEASKRYADAYNRAKA